jgi:hypothetical protein
MIIWFTTPSISINSMDISEKFTVPFFKVEEKVKEESRKEQFLAACFLSVSF